MTIRSSSRTALILAAMAPIAAPAQAQAQAGSTDPTAPSNVPAPQTTSSADVETAARELQAATERRLQELEAFTAHERSDAIATAGDLMHGLEDQASEIGDDISGAGDAASREIRQGWNELADERAAVRDAFADLQTGADAVWDDTRSAFSRAYREARKGLNDLGSSIAEDTQAPADNDLDHESIQWWKQEARHDSQ